MRTENVVSHDGISLNYVVSHAGKEKPWITLVMPFGLTLDLTQPFTDFFSVHYNVLAWESRLILDQSSKIYKKDDFTFEKHVYDLLAVVTDNNIKQSTLIGYCSGAGIALGAINRAPQLFDKLLLVHGEYTLLDDSNCTTQFSMDIDNLLSLAAKGKKQANLVFEKIQSQRFYDNSVIPKGIELPFTKLNYLRRYATNYLSYKEVDFEKLARFVNHRTLILTGDRDAQANTNSSKKIQEHIKHSEIYIDPNADHYGIVREESETLVLIWNYLCQTAAVANC